VSAGAILAGTGAPDKLDKFSTRVPPPAPPAGEAVDAPSGAVVPGPSAKGTADMAGAARDEERKGRGAHGDERTHRRHRPGRGWRRGHLKMCIVAAPIFAHNEVGRTTRAPDVIVNGSGENENADCDWPLANLCSFILQFFEVQNDP
jgi:hypothetical protein